MGTEETSRHHQRPRNPRRGSSTSDPNHTIDSDDIFMGSHETVTISQGGCPLTKKHTAKRTTTRVSHKRKKQSSTTTTSSNHYSYIDHLMGYFRIFIRSNVEWVTSRVHSYIEKHPLLVRTGRGSSRRRTRSIIR
jgi:hypothetical protein